MFRIKKKHIVFIPVLLFAMLIVIKHMQPEQVDWSVSFSGYKKIPYGCSVTRLLLKDIFTGSSIDENNSSFFISLKKSGDNKRNLVVVTTDFYPDSLDLQALLHFVSKGNNVFMSAFSFSEELCDTLGIKDNETTLDTSVLKKYPEKLHLAYYADDSAFHFSRRMSEHYFMNIDSADHVIVLGTDRFERPDYIMTEFGKGKIFMHCEPLALTNYHILYSNHQYAAAVLSAMPVLPVIWDQFYKPDRVIDASPMRYILSEKSLRSAWYLITFTILVYLIFGAKRRQHAIEIIDPPQNSSLEFIKSIGKLYYKGQNHIDIAKKKVIYLREFLRNRYGFRSIDFSEENIKSLAEKTGAGIDLIDEMLRRAAYTEKSLDLNAEELIRINFLIEEFYKKCK
ncbi:MAG TPA: DUF4350 domain-containing protein [Bacteroidales bacterium]|nr:DUF4350 domain-containing protein [Bacteroidales bacterium]